MTNFWNLILKAALYLGLKFQYPFTDEATIRRMFTRQYRKCLKCLE